MSTVLSLAKKILTILNLVARRNSFRAAPGTAAYAAFGYPAFALREC